MYSWGRDWRNTTETDRSHDLLFACQLGGPPIFSCGWAVPLRSRTTEERLAYVVIF